MAEIIVGKYYIPIFDKTVEVRFGSDRKETGWEEDKVPPTEDEIKKYENALKDFIENIDKTVEEIKEAAFTFYKIEKAPYGYGEDFEKEYSLKIDDKEKHFECIKDLYAIRVVKVNQGEDVFIVLKAFYEKIDTEHKMEILLKNNRVVIIAEVEETYWWNMEELNKIIKRKEDMRQKLEEKV
jgi:hypothetical protein